MFLKGFILFFKVIFWILGIALFGIVILALGKMAKGNNECCDEEKHDHKERLQTKKCK